MRGQGQLVEYIVKRHGQSGQWAIVAGYDVHSGYLSEFAAIQDAVDAAYESGQAGYRSCVVTQNKDKPVKLRWTYGEDAYPYDGRNLEGDKVTDPRQSLMPAQPANAGASAETV